MAAAESSGRSCSRPTHLVLLLWEHYVLTVKDLGQYLLLDSGTLVPLLKRLEPRGLVRC